MKSETKPQAPRTRIQTPNINVQGDFKLQAPSCSRGPWPHVSIERVKTKVVLLSLLSTFNLQLSPKARRSRTSIFISSRSARSKKAEIYLQNLA